ncbi:MAG: hypothetical protein Q3983_10245, partial [Capnocytophaga sp.]|nr:hypothetical protein [Capnocytophaga sp.]
NNQINKIENKITELEKEIADMDTQLTENFSINNDFLENYQLKKQELDALMEEWENLSLKLNE